MNPTTFPEANTLLGPPKGLVESQCATIPGYFGEIQQGSLDSERIFVVAWLPNAEEVDKIVKGNPIFITFVGGIPPHYPSMSFKEATTPA